MTTLLKDLKEAAEIFRDGMDRLLNEGVCFPSETRAELTIANNLNKVIGMQVNEETKEITLLCSTQSGFGYYTLKGEVISLYSITGGASYFLMINETNAVSDLPRKKDWVGAEDLFSWENKKSQLY